MIPLQCKQSTRVSRDYFKMRFDLSERIIWAGPNTMIYFHNTWKKNNYCRIHHLWIRQSVLNVDNVIVIAALLYNNLAMTSPYWCPPSRLCLSVVRLKLIHVNKRARGTRGEGWGKPIPHTQCILRVHVKTLTLDHWALKRMYKYVNALQRCHMSIIVSQITGQ